MTPATHTIFFFLTFRIQNEYVEKSMSQFVVLLHFGFIPTYLSLEWLLELQHISGQNYNLLYRKLAPKHREQQETKERDVSRLVVGLILTQETGDFPGAATGVRHCTALQHDESLYRGLAGFSHILGSEGLNNTRISQGRVLENGSYRGIGFQNLHSEGREGREISNCPGQLKSRVNPRSQPLITSSNLVKCLS